MFLLRLNCVALRIPLYLCLSANGTHDIGEGIARLPPPMARPAAETFTSPNAPACDGRAYCNAMDRAATTDMALANAAMPRDVKA